MLEVEHLMCDKSFYTLIRRFRYQHKKYMALRDLDGEYYDKHLRKAYKNAKDELRETTEKLILVVFGAFLNPNNTSLEFSQDVLLSDSWGGRIGCPHRNNQKYEVTVDSKAYYDFVVALMRFYYER